MKNHNAPIESIYRSGGAMNFGGIFDDIYGLHAWDFGRKVEGEVEAEFLFARMCDDCFCAVLGFLWRLIFEP